MTTLQYAQSLPWARMLGLPTATAMVMTVAFFTACSDGDPAATTPAPEVEESAQDPPSELRITHVDGELRLAGTLPDERTVRRVTANVTRTYMATVAADSLTVGDVGEPLWLDQLPEILRVVKAVLPTANLELRGPVVRVVGRTDDENLRAELGERLRSLGSGLRVQNRVQLTVLGAQEVEDGLAEILSDQSIEFEHVSPTLTAGSLPVLDEIAALLARYPEVTIRIESHMDGLPEDPIVRRLSTRRAQEIRVYLSQQGIAEQRLRPVGQGATQQIAPRATVEGRSVNDRVELYVVRNN